LKISTRIVYALRGLFDIAYHGVGHPVQVKEVARRQKIPQRYLEQIFQELRKTGILESKRGPHGGYALCRPALELTVGEVMRALGEWPRVDFASVHPAEGPADFPGGPDCVTSFIWRGFEDTTRSFLDSITIEKICDKGKLLGIEREPGHNFMFYI
jgi:Rrf2 family protein